MSAFGRGKHLGTLVTVTYSVPVFSLSLEPSESISHPVSEFVEWLVHNPYVGVLTMWNVDTDFIVNTKLIDPHHCIPTFAY